MSDRICGSRRYLRTAYFPLLLEISAQVTSGEENTHDINLVIDALVDNVVLFYFDQDQIIWNFVMPTTNSRHKPDVLDTLGQLS